MGTLLNFFTYSFQPVNVPGLTLWLDAQDASTFTLSGSAVSQWRDKSGRGNHAVQATGSLQPTLAATGINSRAAVNFGATHRLTVVDHPTLDHTSLDIFAVLQRNVDSGAAQAVFNKYGGATLPAEFQLVVTSGDVWQMQGSTTGVGTNINVLTGVTATVGQPALIECGHTGSNGFVSVNGASPVLDGGSSGIVNSDGNLTLGRAIGADFQGSIGEFLYFNRHLTAAERTEIVNYLKAKWGLT
jgi:hypothetical protein